MSLTLQSPSASCSGRSNGQYAWCTRSNGLPRWPRRGLAGPCPRRPRRRRRRGSRARPRCSSVVTIEAFGGRATRGLTAAARPRLPRPRRPRRPSRTGCPTRGTSACSSSARRPPRQCTSRVDRRFRTRTVIMRFWSTWRRRRCSGSRPFVRFWPRRSGTTRCCRLGIRRLGWCSGSGGVLRRLRATTMGVGSRSR